MASLPITIDFERFCTGADEVRRSVARDVDRAFRRHGYFQMSNHGLRQKDIDTCFEWSRRFFMLPEEEKLNLCPAIQSFGQGYIGMERERMGNDVFLKESFQVGIATSWPSAERLPGFQEFALDFHQKCTHLVTLILSCLSNALQLEPEESFERHHDGSLFVSSILRYPAIPEQSAGPRNDYIRSPPHSDLSTVSLLFLTSPGDLEIADMHSTDKVRTADIAESANFLQVKPAPGTILIVAGYLLMRWTNSYWRSPVSRLVEPSKDRSGLGAPERHCLAFFGYPNADTIIEPLSRCLGNEGSKWKPLNAGEFLLKKRAQLYSK